MSDLYCPQCGQYHASLTVCPNLHKQAVYTQRGTTTIDLDEMRAEIVRLRAREANLREALEELVAVQHEEPKCDCEICVATRKARAALCEEEGR